jgi:hypothetical protein
MRWEGPDVERDEDRYYEDESMVPAALLTPAASERVLLAKHIRRQIVGLLTEVGKPWFTQAVLAADLRVLRHDVAQLRRMVSA